MRSFLGDVVDQDMLIVVGIEELAFPLPSHGSAVQASLSLEEV